MESKKKKLLIALLASLTGISGLTAGSAILAYEATFPRIDRPNYALVAGEYCYDRVRDVLPRKELFYKVKDSTLSGYYYKSMQSKGLVIVVHGIKSGGDDYLPLIKSLVGFGYDVFSYNCTGTYESSGDDTVGMCQALIDLEGTINYIQGNAEFNVLPLFLVGHSLGGYAVTSVLALCPEIKGCVAIAGMNNACTMMADKAEEYVGPLSNVPAPIFSAYQRILFGDYVEYTAVKGINSTTAPVLLAHGVEDKIIRFNKQSIIACKKELTNPNVSHYVGKGLQGTHDGIWHSKEALAYQMEVESDLRLLEMQKGDKLTDEEKANYYATVNHALYSEVNVELMQQIVALFDSVL